MKRMNLRMISMLTIATLLSSIAGCNVAPSKKENNNVVIDNKVKFDSNVVPINWDNLKTEPLTGELAEGIRYLINNGTKYIVNDWWNKVWRFNSQEDNEYLTTKSNGEHHIRPLTHQARTLAASIVLNIYDEDYTGVPKETAKQMAIKLTVSLAKAHYANTKDGWGNAWQSAYWAADVAHAGWLLWDDLSEKDREYIQNCTVTEANRFINYKVPYYKNKEGTIIFKGDSKAEENAWNSNILSVACAMMPNHENYNVWMHKNCELMISSFAIPSDIGSKRIVSGYRLSELLNGSNANEDGTVTNHNIVHPDYQSTVAINLLNGIFFAFGNQQIPEAILFNSDVVYESFVELDLKSLNKNMEGQHIYKRNKDNTASHEINYPNGTDWGYDRQICFFLVDVFADIFKFDKDCSVKGKDFALSRIPVMEAMQDRNTDGKYYTSSDDDKYASREEWVMWHAIVSYMALWADQNNLFNITDKYPIKAAPLNDVTLNIPLQLVVDKKYETTYTLNPGLLSLPKEAAITYLSNNENIATISKTGEIHTKNEGKASISIKITFKDIIVSDTVDIQVVSEAKSMFSFDDLPIGTTLPQSFKWNNVGNAKIIEDDSHRVLELSGNGYNYIFITEDFEGDFTISFKMKIESHVQKGGGQVLFREDSSLFTGRNGYQFCYGDTMNSEFGLELRQRDGALSNNKFKAVKYDENWHSFEISMKGDTATLKMDGSEVMTHDLTGFTKGSIALCSYLDTILFDDIEIKYN